MAALTTYERMSRTIAHRDADRVPITDWIWDSTVVRWRNEGIPAEADPSDYLGLDRIFWLSDDLPDTSPRFAPEVTEETDTYRIERNQWGVTVKNLKPVCTTLQGLDFRSRPR